MGNLRTGLLLSAIVFLALTVRLYLLSVIPPGLNRDEAALGYNAYSLLLTGKDEFGRSFPLNLESFGDWKLPGYSLLLMSLEFLFGLTVFTTRLLSALAGCISVIFVYFLAARLIGRKFALLSALLFAFLPWNIFFSRVAYEANVALTLILAGTLFFLKGIRQSRFFLASSIFFGAGLFVYHSSQLFTPLFVLALVGVSFRSVPRGKNSLLSLLIFLVLLGVSLTTSLSGDKTKLAGISVFSDKSSLYNKIDIPRSQQPGLLGKLLHNKPLYFTQTLISNHLGFYLPAFLVTQGGANPQHNLPGRGNLSPLDYLLLLVGLLLLLKSNWKHKPLLLLWLFLSPLASTITRDAPQYTRSVFAAGIIPLIEAFALVSLKNHRTLSRIFLIILPVAFFFSLITFFISYFVDFPRNGRQIWNQPLISMAQQAIATDARQVVVSHPDYSPYIFILFYDVYGPGKFQTEVTRYPPTDEGFVHVRSFGRYSFPYTNDPLPTLHIIAP